MLVEAMAEGGDERDGVVVSPVDRKAAEIEAAWAEYERGAWQVLATRRRKRLTTLAEAQNWRCCYCGCRMQRSTGLDEPQDATIEHILCRCHGGTDDPDNLVVACRICNGARANAYWPEHWKVLGVGGEAR